MKRAILAISAILLIFLGLVLEGKAQAKKPWAAPRAGNWTVTARDEENTDWNGRLTLVRKGAGKYRGHFYWISGDRSVSGREYFNGSFDRITGKLKLTSYKVKNIKGELGTGDYFARVNNKGRNIVRGSWTGEDNVPGNWKAVWNKAK